MFVTTVCTTRSTCRKTLFLYSYRHQAAFSSAIHGDSPVVVALSGGVDSAVCAALLKERYRDVSGLYMRNWTIDEGNCDHHVDWKDAQQVAACLQIPIHQVSFAKQYWLDVFDPYVQNLQKHGIMGNPDILCNRHVKFDVLLRYVDEQFGAAVRLATGHYARLHRRTSSNKLDSWLDDWGDSETPLLQMALDRTKDQTYFLAGCSGRNFSNVLFPLGELYKISDTRRLAQQYNLPVAQKKDSMGICFVGKQHKFSHFIKDYLENPETPVTFQDVETNEILAASDEPEHAYLFVEGQKARLGGLDKRYYVAGHNKVTNTVYVGGGAHHPSLYRNALFVDDMSWWVGEAPPLNNLLDSNITCRIRHQEAQYKVMVYNVNGRWKIQFDQPARAMTVGQWAVLYCGEFCLGGGPIAELGPSCYDLQREVTSV